MPRRSTTTAVPPLTSTAKTTARGLQQAKASEASATPTIAAERLEPDIINDIRDSLRGWYFTRKRRLPWRDDPTGYRVWVSEIMLQQTQVATVIPYFERFLEAFPTVSALAAAPEEAVMGQWSGLGYYRRARNLHAGAKKVASELGGIIPNTVEGLLTIPGVGRYTAGAIASIAFAVRAPLLDGNVARVFARVFAVEVAVDGTEGQRRLWNLAETLVPADDPSSHNQALMELGALVCSPRDPACGECPLVDRCRAFALGTPTAFPIKKKKAGPQPVLAVAGLLTRPSQEGDVVLFAQRPEGLLGGLWELPGGEVDDVSDSESAGVKRLGEIFRARTGIAVDVGPLLATVMHQFTHRTLTLRIYSVASVAKASGSRAFASTLASNAGEAAVPDAAPPDPFYTAMRWLSPETVGAEVALSTLTRKVLAAARSASIEPSTAAKRPRRSRGNDSLELPL